MTHHLRTLQTSLAAAQEPDVRAIKNVAQPHCRTPLPHTAPSALRFRDRNPSSMQSSSRTVVSSSRVVSSSGGGGSASASMSASAGGGGMAMSSMSMRRSASYGMSAGAGVAPGVSCQIAHSGVKNIVAGRTREKSDMQELNSRFASYIEQVRQPSAADDSHSSAHRPYPRSLFRLTGAPARSAKHAAGPEPRQHPHHLRWRDVGHQGDLRDRPEATSCRSG